MIGDLANVLLKSTESQIPYFIATDNPIEQPNYQPNSQVSVNPSLQPNRKLPN